MSENSAPVKAPVGRFAPSPSGRMHPGNLFSSLLAWLYAKSAGGKIILRIENLDTLRTTYEFADGIRRDYELLGLTWDEGAYIGGPDGPYFQSDRSAYYEHCLEILGRKARLYPCFCSRAQLHAASAPHASDGELLYSGRCRNLTPAEIADLRRLRSPATRIEVPDIDITIDDLHCGHYTQNLARGCGDFLLRRSDGVFAYQLAVTADDAAMGVTQVVRGRDLLSSAPRQAWLHTLLGYTPPQFCHVPLLMAEDGRRLSKRDGDLSLDALLEKFTPAEITGRLAYLAGQLDRPEAASPAELVKIFDPSKIPQGDIPVPDGLFI